MRKDEAYRRVHEAAMDARSGDDMVDEGFFFGEDPDQHPLDRETLDERYSTQMGEMYESRRRDAS